MSIARQGAVLAVVACLLTSCGHPAGSRSSTGPSATPPHLVHVPLLFAEAVPGVIATYIVDTETTAALAHKFVESRGGHGVSGRLDVPTTGYVALLGVTQPWKRHRAPAVVVEPQLAFQASSTCHAVGWYSHGAGTTARVCDHHLAAHWTGGVRNKNVDYQRCTVGSSPPTITNNHDDFSWITGASAEAAGTREVGDPLLNVGYAEKYGGRDTEVKYAFDKSKQARRFCLGGNGPDLADSPRVYISRVVKPRHGCRPFSRRPCPGLKPWEITIR